MTPLTFSLLAETMADHMVRRSLRQAGEDALAAEPVLRRHASHVYVNAALVAGVVRLLPSAVRSHGLLDLLPAALRADVAPTTMLVGAARTALIIARFVVREPAWSPWQRAAAFDRAASAVRARLGTSAPLPEGAGARALVAEIRGLRAALGAFLETVSWGVVFAYVFYHLLHELCRRWAPDSAAEVAALTVGLPGIASIAAARDVAAVGRLVAADAMLRARVGRDDADGAAVVAASSGPAGEAFRAVVATHGHRLIGRDLACPSWREAPEIVLRLALRAMAAEPHVPDAAARRADATARIESAIGGGVAGPLRLAVFRPTLAATQRYYVVRENMRYYADFFLARMRTLALAAGARLVATGALARADDVFFLELEELEDASAGGRSFGIPVAERRRALAHDTASPPPVVLGSTSDARSAPDDRPRLTLTGECAAPGVCRGTARVVHAPDDFAAFARGDVMIASYTDPGWTPILELACGLVLDAGGQLSHGAIVARELGIPALVNVTDATRAITTGDVVELDATAGTVRVVRRSREA